jgi:hypothetical protein
MVKNINEKTYQIIDNFLDVEYYSDLKKFLHSEDLQWFYRDKNTDSAEDCFFTHSFFNNFQQGPYNDYLKKFYEKIDARALVCVRANLVVAKENHFYSDWHTDYIYPNCWTGILYFTTCNGETHLQINEEQINIKSIENRLVIFKTSIKHRMKSQTNTKRRIILNLNYFV